MALTNNEQVGKAIELLAEGLAPFVDRVCRIEIGDNWHVDVQRTDRRKFNPEDPYFLLKVMEDKWQTIFSKKLSPRDFNYISDLQYVRNSWAHKDHKERFSSTGTLWALDTAKRLLKSVAATDQATQVDELYQDLLRQLCQDFNQQFDHQAQGTRHQAAPAPNQPTDSTNPTDSGVCREVDKRPISYAIFGVLKPWRSGIGMWADVVKKVHSRHKHNFLEIAKELELERSSRFHGKLISDNPQDISRPRNSGVNGIYIERSLTISQLIELAYRLLRMFDHTDSDLVIYWD